MNHLKWAFDLICYFLGYLLIVASLLFLFAVAGIALLCGGCILVGAWIGFTRDVPDYWLWIGAAIVLVPLAWRGVGLVVEEERMYPDE